MNKINQKPIQIIPNCNHKIINTKREKKGKKE